MSLLARASAIQPLPFGSRYSLIRQLATGGMAEVYLARQSAMAGFEKEVVIKRLKPELAGDTRIVEMFLDEARIGALLNHPNIVHVYDVDEHDGIPYIAMEYIVGEELNELCQHGLNLGKFLPLEHAVELMRQAAAGMGYFHAKRGHAERGHTAGQGDGAGDPLDIVHCDISPTNLLVTEDGFLKLIDFGIARARGQRFRDEGVFPGKLSYMSPEQALRQRVDHRSDIYSLGIVLYEITVGRRLFKGPANEVIRRLTEGQIEPPTFTRRSFPPALETIVMRALERHPVDRYQSAYDLADDLEEFLRDAKLHSGPVPVARYLDELAHLAGGQRRAELISEHEQAAVEDELDFDTAVFETFSPAAVAEARGPSEWDEYEEGDDKVAAALGLELAQLRALRTPVPGHPAADAGRDPRHDDDDRPRGATGGPPPSARPPSAPVRNPSPARARSQSRAQSPSSSSTPATPSRPPSRVTPPAPLPASSATMAAPVSTFTLTPWVLLGSLGALAIAAAAYFLL